MTFEIFVKPLCPSLQHFILVPVYVYIRRKLLSDMCGWFSLTFFCLVCLLFYFYFLFPAATTTPYPPIPTQPPTSSSVRS